MNYEEVKFDPELISEKFKEYNNKSNEDEISKEEIYDFLDSTVIIYIILTQLKVGSFDKNRADHIYNCMSDNLTV